ncbi:hypothetical protein [Embleya sp. NPDC001921]
MAAFATVEQYAARSGPVTGADAAKVQATLDDASALIRSRLPRGFTPDPGVALAMTVVIARRAITNPGGYRQRTIGQYSETLGEAGGLYLTDGELASLLGDSMGDGDAAYSVICADEGPIWSPPRGCW